MTHTSRPHSLTFLILSSLSSLTFAACAGQAQRAPVATPTSITVVPSQPAPVSTSTDESRAKVRAVLASRRAIHLARLRAYSDRGEFPRNREKPGMLRIFVDDGGALCAVANLIWQDGKTDLVQQTAAKNNYISLIDVTDGPLMAWMQTSGFTQDEIDQIQEPGFMAGESPDNGPDLQLIAEVERKRKRIAAVLKVLEANQQVTLDAMTDEILASPTLLASL